MPKRKAEDNLEQKVEKPRHKKALVDMAKKFCEGNKTTTRAGVVGGILDYDQACQLWLKAADGSGVTMQEFATLEFVLETYAFTKKARIYLDSLVTKHESGTSMYKIINKVKYDRSCLDLAAHLTKDGLVDVKDARLLWEDVLDGVGVTDVEKRTIEYIMKEYKVTAGAKKYLKEQLAGGGAAAAAAGGGAAASRVALTQRPPAFQPAPNAWHGFGGFGNNNFGPFAGKIISKSFEFNMPAKAYGLFVNGEHCYAGDESGLVVQLSTVDGSMVKQYRLPDGVKCMVADNGFLFAGCNNGSLYDLTGGRPRLVAELEDFTQILWLDIHAGNMVASDASGNVALVNCEGETLWKKTSAGAEGWMVRVDESGVYHGHAKGVTKYDLSGAQLWHTATEGVLFGCLANDSLYASLVEPNCFDGEIAKRLSRAGAKTGEVVCSLMWNNHDDLDLHVYAPSGEHIYYSHKRSACGGELDVDMNAGMMSDEPVENVYWGKAPGGHYRVTVINFSNRTQQDTPFEVHINIRGEKKKFTGMFEKGSFRGEKVIHEFDLEASAESKEEKSDAPPQKAVVQLNKTTGAVVNKFNTQCSVPSTAVGNTNTVYAAISQGLACFQPDGTESWKLGTGAGSAMSMQAVGDKLYAVCGTKVLCCDVTDEAVAKAKQGSGAVGVQVHRNANVAETTALSSSADLEQAAAGASGVRVCCVKEGSKVRVRPEAGQAGFDSSKNVQFPRNIRQEGARFLVDGLVLAGSFYRVQGNICRL